MNIVSGLPGTPARQPRRHPRSFKSDFATGKSGYSVWVEQGEPNHKARVGLCETCKFMRRIESDRGSIFYMCLLSLTDASFPKYPRLPVLNCGGYKRWQDDPEGSSDH